MRILIIEDSEFNAFCLRRLLESVVSSASITIANTSNEALSLFYSRPFDLAIIGELGPVKSRTVHCNGPELAQILLHKYPNVLLIAWTDSMRMRQEFSYIFNQYNHTLNKFNLWNKTVTIETICKTWTHYFIESNAMHTAPYKLSGSHTNLVSLY